MTLNEGRGTDDVTTIREGIERTRREMSRTVGAIEERLSPANVKEQVTNVKEHVKDQLRDAKDQAKAKVRDATVGRVENMVQGAREAVTDTGSNIVATIKENPIPAALVAVGLGWLFMSGRRREQPFEERYEGAYEPIRAEEGRVGRIAEGAKGMAHDVREKASGAAHEAKTKGRRVVRQMGTKARRAEQSVESTFRDNPLAAGAVALALGAALGLLLPHTRKEDELMGGAKHRIAEKAGGAAKQMLGKVEEKVESTVSRLNAEPPQSQEAQPNGLAPPRG